MASVSALVGIGINALPFINGRLRMVTAGMAVLRNIACIILLQKRRERQAVYAIPLQELT